MGSRAARRIAAIWCAAVLISVSVPASSVTMRLIDNDGSDEGLNDAKSTAPVGGNPGRTLGDQRRIALQYAADILGRRLVSAVSVRIAVEFNGLDCSANSGTLGQASPTRFSANFSGAPEADTYYPLALANALARRRLDDASDDIEAEFNRTLDAGGQDCLQGATWYYGLDGRAPDGQINFVSTAVHELIHGLGFLSLIAKKDKDSADLGQFPKASTGERWPDIYSRFLKDLSIADQPTLPQMTLAQRVRALTDGPSLVWADANTNSQAATLLTAGFNQGYVEIYAPTPIDVGSSISHWDPSLTPNQVMEPYTTRNNNVVDGIGMAACVLENIGWQLAGGIRCPDVDSAAQVGDIDPNETSVQTGSADAGDDDGGGGGGCTIDPKARFDPTWLVLLGLALTVLAARRRPR